MASIADILAKGYAQDTAFDRRKQLADTLLGAGAKASSPLVAALSGLVGGYELQNIANEQADLEKQMQSGTEAMPGFEGTSMEAQAFNILLDPSKKGTPIYQAAYDFASQPKILPDGTRIEPNLRFLKTLDKQIAGQYRGELDTAPPTIASGNLPSPTDKSLLREVQTGSQVIKNELKKFGKAVDEASDSDFAAAAAGGITEGGQKLVGAWTTTALSAKGKALLDLGVLNGPDLEVIQGMLPNPGSVGGAFATKAAYKQAIKNVNEFVDSRVKEYEKRYGTVPQVEGQNILEQGGYPEPPIDDEVYSQARAAIAKGANRQQVIQRLQKAGYDPGLL